MHVLPSSELPAVRAQRTRLAIAVAMMVLLGLLAIFAFLRGGKKSPRATPPSTAHESASEPASWDVAHARTASPQADRRSFEAAQSDYSDSRPLPPPRRPQSPDERRRSVRAMLNQQGVSLDHGLTIGPSSPSAPIAPASPKPVSLSAEVHDLTPIRSSGDIWFVGMLKNTGDSPLDHPRIAISLWNRGRTQLLATIHRATERSVLSPHSSTPFKVLVRKTSPFAEASASVELTACLDHCESGKLTLLSHHMTVLPPLVRLVGTIRNDEDVTQEFVKVIALARDSHGRPLDQAFAFVSGTKLAPRATGTFETYFVLSRKPAKLDFDLEGWLPD